MKMFYHIGLIISFVFLSSCEEQVLIEYASVQRFLKNYTNDSIPERYVDVDRFNKEQKNSFNLIVLNNHKDSLEFVLFDKNMNEVRHFYRGVENVFFADSRFYLVVPYFQETKVHEYIDILAFNKDYLDKYRLVAINNRKDSLEFVLFHQSGESLFYYKKGSQNIMYESQNRQQ